MAGMIPLRKSPLETAGNGGALELLRDFPSVMRRMQRDFDDLLQRYSRDWPLAGAIGSGWRWGLVAEEKDDSLVVRAEAPGFEAEGFDIQVSDNRLDIRASRKEETKKKGRETREECECCESVMLPSGIDKDKVDARYHNGVLTITIPRTPQGKAKKVTVKT